MAEDIPMDEQPEQRRYPRMPLEVIASLRRVDGGKFDLPTEAIAKDISRGGVFIETDDRFEIGSFVGFDVRLHEDEEVSSIIGLVRWRNQRPPEGIGVEIVMVEQTDKRRSPRMALELFASITRVDEQDLRSAGEATVRNISCGGLFLETSVPIGVGSSIEFDVRLPDEQEAVAVAGVVRWSSDRSPVGVGVEIVRGKEVLDAFLQEHVLYQDLVRSFEKEGRRFLSREFRTLEGQEP